MILSFTNNSNLHKSITMKKKQQSTPYLHSNNQISRRDVIKLGLTTGTLSLTGIACSNSTAKPAQWTPRQTEGPFYPIHDQRDKDIDLTLVHGRGKHAEGDVIHVRGRVLDTNGNLLNRAFVEIWQANKWGRYRHARDPNRAPLDPNFQGWGQTVSNERGEYGFKTILPGAYPAGPGWTRPPHIHFKVAKKGFMPLTTQMYFPGQTLNEIDRILQSHSPAEQKMLIATEQSDDNDANSTDGNRIFVFDIVLRGA
jgi:protocatechuate 3,4-dioxygenase beta subunit